MLPQGKKQITHSLKSQQIHMKKYFLGLAVAALSLGLTSCGKKDEPKNPQQGQVKTVVIDASDYTKKGRSSPPQPGTTKHTRARPTGT